MRLTEAQIPGLLAKLRSQLLFSQPFFATLLMNMDFVASEDVSIFATDGEHLYYNPKGVLGLRDATTVGEGPDLDLIKSALCHEGIHPALLHHTRRGDRDPGTWNEAGDHVDNNILKHGGLKVGTDWLCNPKFDGWTADAVYAVLHQEKQQQQQKQQQQNKGGGAGQQQQPKPGGQQQPGPRQPVPKSQGGIGQVIDAPKAKKETQEREWQTALQQAVMVSRAAGKLPAGMERIAEAAKQPALNWRELLRRFISETMFADFRWSKPNRRMLDAGFYLPSPIKEGMSELAFGVDCSGSIWHDKEMVEQFISEVRSVHEELKPERTSVLYFDTRVSRVEQFKASDQIEFHPKGCGGTNFCPLFEYIDAEQLRPKCLIVLTDLEGPTPEAAPDYPVLWACNTPKEGPFGETVHFH